LYSCIASESRNFTNEYFIWNKWISSRGPTSSGGPGAIAPVAPP